jgi:hypothetical protein
LWQAAGRLSPACSPDGAQRNPGTLDPVAQAPDFAALHPGYKKVNQKLGQWPTWQIIPKENRSFTKD